MRRGARERAVGASQRPSQRETESHSKSAHCFSPESGHSTELSETILHGFHSIPILVQMSGYISLTMPKLFTQKGLSDKIKNLF